MDTLPVAVIATLSAHRADFFNSYVLPAIKANNPAQLIIESGGGGAAAKRNSGLARATADYVYHCDDDTILAADCLARLHAALHGTAHAFAYCDYMGITVPGVAAPAGMGPVFVLRGKPWDYTQLRAGNYIGTMSLIRRSAHPGWEDLGRFDDWDLFLRMGAAGHTGIYVPGVLYHSYYLDNGMTNPAADNYHAKLAVIRKKHGIV